MAPFNDVSARRIHDEEDSFLDWDGQATLFEEDEDEDDELDEERDELSGDEDEEDEDDDFEEVDEDVDELDFG